MVSQKQEHWTKSNKCVTNYFNEIHTIILLIKFYKIKIKKIIKNIYSGIYS